MSNCFWCGAELIWIGDHDLKDNDCFDMVTNLSCPGCNAYIEYYRPIQTLPDWAKYPEEK